MTYLQEPISVRIGITNAIKLYVLTHFFVHCRFEDFTPYQEKYVIKLYDSGCLILQQYIHINKNRQQNFKTDFIGNRVVLNPMYQGIQLQIKQTNIMNKV